MSSAYPPGGSHPDFGPSRPTSQDIQHTPVGARVTDKVRQGVFCTATMILQANEEFVYDFVSAMVQPQQVVARVVLSALTTGQFVSALRTNLARYHEQFGPLQPRPLLPPAGGAAVSPEAAAGHPSPAESGAAQPAAAQPGSPGAGEPGSGGLPGATVGGGAGPAATGPAVPQARPPATDISEIYEHLKLPDDMLGGVYANTVIISHTPEEFCFDFVASFYPRSAVTARVFMAAGRVPSFLETMADSFEKYQHKRGRS